MPLIPTSNPTIEIAISWKSVSFCSGCPSMNPDLVNATSMRATGMSHAIGRNGVRTNI